MSCKMPDAFDRMKKTVEQHKDILPQFEDACKAYLLRAQRIYDEVIGNLTPEQKKEIVALCDSGYNLGSLMRKMEEPQRSGARGVWNRLSEARMNPGDQMIPQSKPFNLVYDLAVYISKERLCRDISPID